VVKVREQMVNRAQGLDDDGSRKGINSGHFITAEIEKRGFPIGLRFVDESHLSVSAVKAN
jgi:hypothetical protein